MTEITQEEKDNNVVLSALYGQMISIARREREIDIERTIEVFLRIRKNTDNMYKSTDWSLDEIMKRVERLSGRKIELKMRYIKP